MELTSEIEIEIVKSNWTYWNKYGPVSSVQRAGEFGPSFLNSIFA
jgi:hypothetical protein